MTVTQTEDREPVCHDPELQPASLHPGPFDTGTGRSGLISVKVACLYSSPVTTETTVREFPGKFQSQRLDTAIQHPLNTL